MTLMETNDPKNELLKQSARQRAALDEEVRSLSERTEKVITNTLIIGGALALSYLLVRQFSKSKKSKAKAKKSLSGISPEQYQEKEESKLGAVFSEIGTTIASHAVAILLAVAKEKLVEYIESQAEKKKEKDEHS